MWGGVFGCLDLYLGVWTCILYTVYLQSVCILVGCDYGVRAPTTAWSMCLPQAFFFLENDAPGIFEHDFVDLLNFH